jgi:signal transduction histidine kinase
VFSQHSNLMPDLKDATLRWLNELVVQGILTTDADLRIAGWNRWLEQQSGVLAEAALGQQLFEVYPDLLSRGIDKYYQQALAGRVVVLSQRFHRYLLPMPPGIEGTAFAQMQQSARIAPLTIGDRIVGTITLIDDVTERVVREEELKQRIEDLEALQVSLQEAVREREAFVSVASHELKTPLTGLLGHAHLMQRRSTQTRSEILPPRALQSLDVIVAQAERLNALVSSLLDVSRVQTGQFTIEPVPLELVAHLEHIIAEESARLSRHTLVFSKPDEPVIVIGDEVRLAQMFTNLISNAIKYSPSGGLITVQVAVRDEQAVVSITDPGVGIPAAALPSLFQRFFRVTGQATPHVGGLGIGLYVVKEIVAQHGGTISVESAEGVGSTFTVTLPLLGHSLPLPGPAANPSAI